MLCKVLPPDKAAAVEPLPWRRAPGSTGPIIAKVEPGPKLAAGLPAQPASVNGELRAAQARLAEVQSAAEARIREAREAGYREGEMAGRTNATSQVQPMLEKLARSIQEISELRPKLRREAEGDLLKLALAIAKKVLHREISADPEALSGLIRVAVEKVRVQEIVRIRLHPQHQSTVQQMVGRISGGVPIEILSDQRLPVGGVVVETTRGEFDASVDVQLREIERGLTDRLASQA